MKSTTNVWIAIRNIGDSQDRGDCFNGTLSESILWMAAYLAKVSMAGRIVVGIGRSQEDALRGIDVKHAGRTALDGDMKVMLDGIFDDDSQEETIHALVPSVEKIAGDDYVS